MPVSAPVDIVNLALAHLGDKALVDLNGQSLDPEGPDTARLMKTLYAPCRDELLVLQPWHFATVRALPALLVATPLYGYTNAYQLPQGGLPAMPTDPVPPPFCLRVLDTNLDPTWNAWWGVWGWGPGTWPWPLMGRQGLWQIEGRTLVTNEVDLMIRYIAVIEDVTIYTPSFVAALAGLMAQRAARALTQNENVVTDLRDESKALTRAARNVEGQEGSQLQYISTALTEVRW